jgi:hypothetical protein
MAHLFRIDGLTQTSESALRHAVACQDARLHLAIDLGRGLVAVEGADGPAIEKALQAASAEAGVTYRGPIAPHHDTP